MGSHDGEGDALLGKYVEGRSIDGSFRKPHPQGIPPEPLPEVSHSPTNLGDLLSPGGQGEDSVVIGLGNGVSVTPPRPGARCIGFQDGPVGSGGPHLHPLQKSGAEVEADELQGVDDVGDAPPGTRDPGGHHSAVTLLGYSLVPVVERLG